MENPMTIQGLSTPAACPDGPPLRQSSIKDCLSCRRKYMYRHRWNIVPKVLRPSAALSCGTLLHLLMEYGPDKTNEVHDIVTQQLAAIEQIIDTPGSDPLGIEANRHKYLTWGWAKALMMATTFWLNHPLPPTLKITAKELHHETTIRLGGDTEVPVSGQLDQILFDTKRGYYYPRDFKTTSDSVEAILTAYQYGIQCRLYRLLADDYLRTHTTASVGVVARVQGFILDILQVPGIKFCSKDRNYTIIRKTKRDGTTEEVKKYTGDPVYTNYLTRCKEWYQARGKEASNSYFVAYAEPVLSPELIWVLLHCNEYRTKIAVPEGFPRDATGYACRLYQRTCEYYPLCSSNEAMWPSILENQYTIAPSEPATDETLDNLDDSEAVTEPTTEPQGA